MCILLSEGSGGQTVWFVPRPEEKRLTESMITNCKNCNRHVEANLITQHEIECGAPRGFNDLIERNTGEQELDTLLFDLSQQRFYVAEAIERVLGDGDTAELIDEASDETVANLLKDLAIKHDHVAEVVERRLYDGENEPSDLGVITFG